MSNAVVPVKKLPEPRIATITTVPDGDYAKNLPTVTLGYYGAHETINQVVVQMIDSVAVDVEEDNAVCVAIFSQEVEFRDDDEYAGDAEIFEYIFTADPEVVDTFFEQVHKINKFCLVISAENFYYEATIECDGLSILKSSFQDRFLH